MKSETNSSSNFALVFGVILTLGVFVVYWPVLTHLVQQLASDEDFSYGLLLPFVSAYLVYLKWPELRRSPWQPSWAGLAVMVLGLFLYLAGKLAAEYYSTRVSFTIFIAGILLLTGGWKILRLLAFPLLLLILMLPLPYIITSTLTLPLQLISSKLAAVFLRALGYPLLLQGNVIDLGIRQLQVVAACSGLRYILSLLALGIIYCYFFQRRPWKGAILLFSLVPAAILANAVRIAAMGVYPALQEGFWHSFTGWLIFVFCFGCLGLLNWGLNYLYPQMQERALAQDSPAEGEMPPSRAPSSYTPFLVAGLIMIVLSGSLIYTIGSPQRVPLLQSFDHFPLQIGPWQGRRTYMDPQIFEKTDADSYFDADFSNSGKEPVSLYLAHYESQVSAGGLGHNPANCMTGSGWKTLESGTTRIAPNMPVSYLLLERQGVRLLVYYWTIQQGQWQALRSARLSKLHTIFNAVRLQRSDWALVRLITPVDQNVELAQERLIDFAHLLAPVLPKFIRE
ncbi:MAG: exosortase C-terminal domain/associated protein EpsI [Desulfobaccales bacterium]